MTHQEIRKKFREFFESKGHAWVPSSSLLPDDPSVLFTTAGMQPMIPYLLGEKHPHGTRIADSQKCFRAQDIEEVGDNRHTTFFEMLGNWSFGDYWKKQQLEWLFEFLTKEIKLDPNKIYVTVFSGGEGIEQDQESINKWSELFNSKSVKADYAIFETLENASKKGIEENQRIFGYGVEKNWWSRSGAPNNMPAGEPGGPDSEVFYRFDTIEHDLQFGEKCHPNCDCGQFMEIGNSVFMEFQKREGGGFEKLSKKNVDFGGGLERMTAASENQADIFMTSTHKKIIDSLGIPYTEHKRELRIIADHMKAAIFLIAEGATPSNKAQGYIVRRLLRRAIRYAKILNLPQNFYEKIFDAIPDLETTPGLVFTVIQGEYEKFHKTLNQGEREIAKHELLDAKIAFDLYQNHGFPFELTEEIARERGQKVEYGEFRKEFEKHQETSRAGLEKKFGGHGLLLDTGELKAANEEELKKVTRLHTATHMLQAALRKVLGDNVHQAGSDITAERLRFDFTFPRKMTLGEIKQVEDLINVAVKQDLKVSYEELPIEDAKKTSALYFFKEKYPDRVKVYTIGPEPVEGQNPSTSSGPPFSREFCGGPHVSHTAEIGNFKILKEEAVSAGIRRIRANVG